MDARVWITLLTDEAADPIMGRFVRQGFGVSPLSGERPTHRGNMCSILALRVSGFKAETKTSNIISLVKPLLEGYVWFSVVVEGGDGMASWTTCQDAPKKEESKSVWERIGEDEEKAL